MKSPNKESILRLLESERAILHWNRDLVDELKRIPHLPLNIPIDLEALQREAQQVQAWSSHELHPSKKIPGWYFEHHRKSFRGQCLVDYTPSGERGMIDVDGYLFEESDAQFDESGRLRFFSTPWGQRMPQTLATLQQISPYLNRTRIVRTPPGGGIFWHSHHNNVYKNEYLRLAVVIVTLETTESATHGVRDFRDKTSPEHRIHYGAGRAVLFNSWHDHDFWNHGASDRLAVISYFNFPDQDLLDFLKSSVADYTGPRLSPG